MQMGGTIGTKKYGASFPSDVDVLSCAMAQWFCGGIAFLHKFAARPGQVAGSPSRFSEPHSKCPRDGFRLRGRLSNGGYG